jgi:hypothetical protein
LTEIEIGIQADFVTVGFVIPGFKSEIFMAHIHYASRNWTTHTSQDIVLYHA